MSRTNLTGYNYVAIISLLGDEQKKLYAFALYDDEFFECRPGKLVVVNPRYEENRVLGIVQRVQERDFSHECVAQVVGVVDCSCYEERINAEKEEREKELREQFVDKLLGTATVFELEAVAKLFPSNKKMLEIVENLKKLYE